MKENLRGILIYVAIFLVLVVGATFMLNNESAKDVPYSEVVTLFNNGEVAEFSLKDSTLHMKLQDGSLKKAELRYIDIF